MARVHQLNSHPAMLSTATLCLVLLSALCASRSASAATSSSSASSVTVPKVFGRVVASLNASNVPKDQYKGPDKKMSGSAVLVMYKYGKAGAEKYDVKYTIVVNGLEGKKPPTEVVVGTGLPFRMGDLTLITFPGSWKQRGPKSWYLQGYFKDAEKNLSYYDELYSLILEDPDYYYLNVRTKKHPGAAIRGHFRKY